ncbi:MAG TPA: hypothetical protein VJQ25_05940 [Nitrospira sp.]|nr:hypothetical protein [Nitrospira sp.]
MDGESEATIETVDNTALVETVAETQISTPQVEDNISASGETPVVETPTEQQVETPAASPPPKDDWRDKRIAKLTAQLREAQAAQAAQGGNQNSDPNADFESRVRAEAARLAAAEQFNARCLDVVNQGRKEFADFDLRVDDLKRIVGSDPTSVNMYSGLIAAAIETGEGAKIIHRLGGDLNLAANLMEMNPVKMGMELAKLALSGDSSPIVSNAPRPIRNLGAAAQHSAIDPTDPTRAGKLSTPEWMKRREAQVAERRRRA